jgi:hypothetical protein
MGSTKGASDEANSGFELVNGGCDVGEPVCAQGPTGREELHEATPRAVEADDVHEPRDGRVVVLREKVDEMAPGGAEAGLPATAGSG